MNLKDITNEEIEVVTSWLIDSRLAKSKLKKAYYRKKGENLAKKYGWKFYTILQEASQCWQEEAQSPQETEEEAKEKGR